MPRLAPRPVAIDMRFVIPDIKRGDYYLLHSEDTGLRRFIYPRKMGEQKFAVWASPEQTDYLPMAGLGEDVADIARQAAGVTQGQVMVPSTQERSKVTTYALAGLALLGLSYFLLKKEF